MTKDREEEDFKTSIMKLNSWKGRLQPSQLLN